MIIRPARNRASGPPPDGWPDRVAPQYVRPTGPDPDRPVPGDHGIPPGRWKRVAYWWTFTADQIEGFLGAA
jgi:hypothetical protein